MNKTSDKITVSLMVFALGSMFFIMTPLWVGICFVIPAFSWFLKYALSHKIISLNSQNSSSFSKSSLLRSGSNTRTTFQKNGYNNSSRRFGVNCTSLTDRRNKYGF